MDKEYWNNRWENQKIEFNQQDPNPFLVEHISVLKLKPKAKILVPLCGKSIDMFWLMRQGYQIVGIELNLQACQDFFAEQGITYVEVTTPTFTVLRSEHITLFCGDFFAMQPSMIGTIDAIYDRAALEALPKDMRVSYAKKITELAKSDAKLLMVFLNYDQSTMQGPPFSIDEGEIEQLYSTHFDLQVLVAQQAILAPHLVEKGLKKAQRKVVLGNPK